MTYKIIEHYNNLTLPAIMALLKQSYWACNRSEAEQEKACQNSDCFGVMDEGRLIGFARVITDYATTFYLADVIIDEAYRHRGIGKALVGHIVEKPEYKNLRGILLTSDAHGLYRQFGFETEPGKAMTTKRPGE